MSNYTNKYNNTLELKKAVINVLETHNLKQFKLADICEILDLEYSKSIEWYLSKILKQIGYKRFIRNHEGKKMRIWTVDVSIPEFIPSVDSNNTIYIYFILDTDNNVIKIGISNNPSYRLYQIITGNPFNLIILGKIKGSQKEERYLHNYFKEFNKRNEWFYYNQEFKEKLLTYLLNREKF